MAVSRLHTWIAGEILLASDLNSEFNNILNNGTAVAFPATAAVSLGGFALSFDAASTISMASTTNGVNLTGGAFNTPQGSDIASATTLNLDTATGNIVDVTGVTTITAVTLSQGRSRWVRFTGILTLTNGASLVIPGAANVTTAAGDYALFMGYASSVVRVAAYLRGASMVATLSGTEALTNKTYNKVTITAPASGATLTIADGKVLTANSSLTLAGTDSTTMTFPGTSATIARTDAANTFTGHQTIEGVTSTGATGTGNLVFSASPTLTGSPLAPTQSANDNSTKIATTAYVDSLNPKGTTYTPTITAVLNSGGTAASAMQYLRIGNTITVSGKLGFSVTGATSQTKIGISLPVASTTSATTMLGGVGVRQFLAATVTQSAVVYADTVNNRAQLEFYSDADTGVTRDWWVHFTYTVA